MDFYVVLEGDIGRDVLRVFREMRQVVEALPHYMLPNGVVISCHLLCRALVEQYSGGKGLPKFSVVDGYFTKGYEHSWLTTADRRAILDMYPVAGAAPFVVATDIMSPWRGMYVPSNDFQKKLRGPQFKEDVAILAAQVKETVECLKIPW